MIWAKWVSVTFGALLVCAAGLSVYGASRWDKTTRALLARLEAARLPALSLRYDARELEGLPAPVQRFFRTVLKDGQPIVAAVSVHHTGTFNLSADGEQWKPFWSEQRVVTRRPGFVWNGHMSMLPGLQVRVHDAYVAGEGILHAAMLGLFSLMDLRGTPEVAQGELMRFFAEMAWYPTALLPSQGVSWTAVDDRSAKATLTDGSLSLTLLFRFDEMSRIESIRAEGRGRTVGDKVVMTPWEGRFSNYEEREGMQVPLQGEVAWITPEGRRPYWRGAINSIAYEFAP